MHMSSGVSGDGREGNISRQRYSRRDGEKELRQEWPVLYTDTPLDPRIWLAHAKDVNYHFRMNNYAIRLQ